MPKRRQPNNFSPVVVYDSMGFIRLLQLAACADGEDVTLLVSDTTRYEVFTREVFAGQIGPAARYAISEKDPNVIALEFKERALRYGATPEAFRLLGLLCPFSKEELNTMSDKLAPKKGNAQELKSAAKKAPVGGATKAKASKGTPEGLVKAREVTRARQDAFREKSLAILVKPTDTTLRGGRLQKLLFVTNSKPKKVGDVLDQEFTGDDGKAYTLDTGALRGMEKRGHIRIG